ncbi:MAG TPA: LysM domain-containing protein, partial [Burkholderiales bacterium]|nr:LysM domain-containing protein [Burkholderiales bacterium]
RNLEAHEAPLVSWQAYTVKRSDRPEKIAAKHGITLARLKEVNGITGRRRIIPGQTLLVPLEGTAEPNLPDLPAPQITRTTYRGAKYRCTMKTSNGKRRVVPCAVPKKPAAAKAAKKPDVKM